jgi:ABC-2 type transport system permease protein
VSRPPSLNATLLRTYTRLHFRSARFYTLLFFYLLLMLLVPALVLTKVSPNPGSASALLAFPVNFFVILATLGSAVLAGDSISQDFSRQGLFTLSQPIARTALVAARFGAAAIAGTTITLVYFAVGAGETYAFYGTTVANYAEIAAFSLLYTLAMISFVMLLSATFYRSQTLSIVISILTIFIFMPIVQAILASKGFEPWPMLTYASGVIDALFSPPYPPHVQSAAGITSYFPTLGEGAAIMAGYVVVSLVLCAAIYRRRELKEV